MNTQVVGIDIGYNTTIFKSKNYSGVFRSVVAPVGAVQLDSSYKSRKVIVMGDNSRWYIGNDAVERGKAKPLNTNQEWFTDENYYRLFVAALSESVLQTATVKVVTGLPIDFLGDRDRLEEIMIGDHTFNRIGKPKQTVTVESVTILPQGGGAFFSELLNDNGQVTRPNLTQGSVGIFDLGGKTTGLLTLKGGKMIGELSSSIPYGGLDVVKELSVILSNILPKERSDYALAEDMENGYITAYGEKIYITGMVKEAAKLTIATIKSRAKEIFGDGFEFNNVIFCGGGAMLFSEQLSKVFKNSTVASNPQMANAIGYYRFGVMTNG